MTDPDQTQQFADHLSDVYFSTAPSSSWPNLCNFLDEFDGKIPKSVTVGQHALIMHRLAYAIGTALLQRDPSLEPHAAMLVARFPPPDDQMVARELGVYANLH